MARTLEMLEKENADLREQMQVMQGEMGLLRQKVQYLLKQMFGSKTEQIDSRQLELLLEGLTKPVEDDPETDPPPPTPPSSSRRKRGKAKVRLPEDLPVQEVIIDPPEVKQNPEDYKLIGQEVTEELDVMAARYFRRLTIRRKYVSKKNREQAPIMVNVGPRLIENSIASVGLVVDTILQKYSDHIPLYRQERILKERYGIELPRKMLCDWIGKAAGWAKPIWQEIGKGVRIGGYMQVDETPIRYANCEDGGCRKGFFWVFNKPGGDVYFEWHRGRSADCLDGMLRDFKGVMQTDDYPAYECYAKGRNDIELAGCWAHARRKFVDALAESPRQAGWFLRQIGGLYEIEATLRGRRSGPGQREAVRCYESMMILDRLKKAMIRKKPSHLPKSLMGKAIQYALGDWEQLVFYCNNGKIEIDNNLVENAIRPTAVGKKNWLFVGHPDAGERGAILYTLIECCRRRGINPRDYLLDIFARLPSMTISEVASLTPENWLAQATQVAG